MRVVKDGPNPVVDRALEVVAYDITSEELIYDLKAIVTCLEGGGEDL